MKQVDLKKKRNDVNLAYTINFMILENIHQYLPDGNQTMFTSEDIMRDRTRDEIYYDKMFERYAEFRNVCFDEIREAFKDDDLVSDFKRASKEFLDTYNKYKTHKLEYNEVFSERNVSNWFKFNRMIGKVQTVASDPKKLKKAEDLVDVTARFVTFYDAYKDWLTEYEIFEKLDKDIDKNGSRSVFYKKDTNPEILTIKRETFTKFADEVMAVLNAEEQEITEFLNSNPELNETEQYTFKVMIDAIFNIRKIFQDTDSRFEFANTSTMNLKNDLSTKIFNAFGPVKRMDKLTIDEIYVHKNELIGLFDEMKYFSALFKPLETLSKAIFGDVEISFEKPTENQTQNSK